MSNFITKSKELIANHSNGKYTKEKISNKKLIKFLSGLIETCSEEKIDENDLFKYEETKSHITYIVNYLMSETHYDKEEEAKIKLLDKLMDTNSIENINILKLFNQLKNSATKEEISIKKNIISIIKSKPNIKNNIIIFNGNNPDNDYLNEDYFYNMVFNGKELIQEFIKKYQVKKVLEFNSNVFDEILNNHQSFNIKCLRTLNAYLEKFDNIYKLYNNFNSLFKPIEKINNILITKKIMDDNYKKYFQNIYDGFEKGVIDTQLSFDKKFAKLEKEQKNANIEIKELKKQLETANKKLETANKKIDELNSKQKQSGEEIKVLNKKVENLDNKLLIFEEGVKDMKEELECPITDEIMKEPVVTPSGNSYEKKALQDWIKIKQTDPKSVKPLNENQIYPNLLMGNVIDKFKKLMEKIEEP